MPVAAMKKKVAVIGSGVSGLSAAYHLKRYGKEHVDVCLIESDSRLGGHAWPHQTDSGTLVDLGFMICNHVTYPNLMRFFSEFDVPLDPTDMGFSIATKCFEWAFCWNPFAFLRMGCTKRFYIWLWEMNRFHSEALQFIDEHSAEDLITLGQWLKQREFHTCLVDGWILPFCEAVWSSSNENARNMQCHSLLLFMRNHGFLTWRVPHWLTPKGRTAVYLSRLCGWFAENGVQTKTNSAVIGCARVKLGDDRGTKMVLEFVDGRTDMFDDVVFATPAGFVGRFLNRGVTSEKLNQTISTWLASVGVEDEHSWSIISVRDREQKILAGFRTSTNKIILHSNATLMPRQRCYWSSWNVIAEANVMARQALAKSVDSDDSDSSTAFTKSLFTYWLQPLQHLPESPSLFETLNPPRQILDAMREKGELLLETDMVHPIIDVTTLGSQRQCRVKVKTKVPRAAGNAERATELLEGAQEQIQGRGGLWLAGAYLHFGFHEDGFRSGIEAARGVLADCSIPLYPVPFAQFHPLHLLFEGQTKHVRWQYDSGSSKPPNSTLLKKLKRQQQQLNKFEYPLAMDYVDVDAGGALHYWWGGLYREDHFGAPDVPLGDCVRARVCGETGIFPSGPIDLLCHMRCFGYCFNPISLFFVWGEGEGDGGAGGHSERARVDFIVSEVRNTPWDQTVVQVLDLRPWTGRGRGGHEGKDDAAPSNSSPIVIRKLKQLHVSPFNDVPDRRHWWEYRITSLPNGRDLRRSTIGVTVSLLRARDEVSSEQCQLEEEKYEGVPEPETRGEAPVELIVTASLAVRPRHRHTRQANSREPALRLPRSDTVGLLDLLRRGPVSHLVQLRVHWQALRLWALKGCEFVPNTTCPMGRTAPMIIERSLLWLTAICLGICVIFELLSPYLGVVFFCGAVLFSEMVGVIIPRTITGRTA